MNDKKTEVFFDKAVFGGYDTTQVDEFVEEVRKLLSSQKKENEVLKQKLTILADKIEEYRAMESATAEETAEATEPADEPVEKTETVAEEPEVSVIATNEAEHEETVAAFEETLAALKAQISEAQATLEALIGEKTALAASLAQQYERCLQTMREEATTTPIEVPVVSTICEDAQKTETATISEPEAEITLTEPVPKEEVAEAETVAAADSETIAAAVAEPEVVAEPDLPQEPDSVLPDEPAPASVLPEESAEQIPSIAETVEAGESVYLNTNAEEMASLSYEEALTMVLKKNGILRTTPVAKPQPEAPTNAEPQSADIPSVPKEELQTTKIIPRVQVPAPAPVAEKPQKKKKERSFFSGIRKSIHNFLEDESDDDIDVYPVEKRNLDRTSELQFGKAYNVKNDQ